MKNEEIKRWYKTIPSKYGDCPLCFSRLNYYTEEEKCTNKKCSYVNGGAFLSKSQAERYKNKIFYHETK